MGCDIHFYVERNVGRKWQSCDTWDVEKESKDPFVPYEKSFYNNRNYRLFSILAGIRNSHNFLPIDSPRGLPPGCSPVIKATSKSWGVDGHSHSYFTIKELLEFDWTQTTKLSGYIDLETFERWNRWGRQHGEYPASWCGGVGGGTTKIVSNEEMEKLVEQYKDFSVPESLKRVFSLFEWETSYHRAADDFWSDTIPRLLALGSPEEIRVVFWFDN